jgi:hypothetical protein
VRPQHHKKKKRKEEERRRGRKERRKAGRGGEEEKQALNQAVEHLLYEHKALSSNLNPIIKKKERKSQPSSGKRARNTQVNKKISTSYAGCVGREGG